MALCTHARMFVVGGLVGPVGEGWPVGTKRCLPHAPSILSLLLSWQEVVRSDGVTEAIVDEGISVVSYQLDDVRMGGGGGGKGLGWAGPGVGRLHRCLLGLVAAASSPC